MKSCRKAELISLILIILTLCFTAGCSKENDPNVLKGIYTRVVTDIGGGGAVIETSDGFIYAVSSPYDIDVPGFHKKAEPGEVNEDALTFAIVQTDKDGTPTGMIPVELDLSQNCTVIAGEEGFYVLTNSEILLINLEGAVIAQRSYDELRPDKGAAAPSTGFLYNSKYTIAETDNGIAVPWGKVCLLLDKSLNKTGEVPLPGQCEQVLSDKNDLWIVYREKDTVTLGQVENGVIGKSYEIPEEFYSGFNYYYMRFIGFDNGYLYGWSQTWGVVRWHPGSDVKETETVIDFFNSGIPGQSVNEVIRYPNNLYYIRIDLGINRGITVKNEEPYRADLYKPVPDKNLSDIKVLTVACAYPYDGLEEQILKYNAAHPELYVQLISYERYNTDDNMLNGSKNRLMLDLTTGLLKPDVLIGAVFEPVNLYPLMTGKVKKEDIAPCVRNQFEVDGMLYQISNQFFLSGLVGRSDVLGERESWTLNEFLDFADGLSDDEYLMEQISRRSSYNKLFGDKAYAPFISGGQSDFENPLYLRYLSLIKSLPEEEETYMDYGKNNYAELAAGELESPEQLEFSEGGENLYFNGKIKLLSVSSMKSLSSITEILGTFGTYAVNPIGFPTESESGWNVILNGQYSIPSTCRDTKSAWAFLEELLFGDSEIPVPEDAEYINRSASIFRTVYSQTFDWLNAMKGLKMFVPYGEPRASYFGYDLETDENGLYMNMSGQIFTLDDNSIGLVKELFETAGNRDSVPDDIRDIAWEEETRYFADAVPMEECARIVQSRVNIWLAENQ